MQVTRMRITAPDDERSRSFDGPDPQACLASRPSGEWNDDDYNVRGYGHHYDRSPTHDYEPDGGAGNRRGVSSFLGPHGAMRLGSPSSLNADMEAEPPALPSQYRCPT